MTTLGRRAVATLLGMRELWGCEAKAHHCFIYSLVPHLVSAFVCVSVFVANQLKRPSCTSELPPINGTEFAEGSSEGGRLYPKWGLV